jgi:arylformamidase
MDNGAMCNVGILHQSLHFGTHIDAPFHFLNDGVKVHELGLETYCGVAAVIDARGRKELKTDLFEDVDFNIVKRLLIRTGVWTDHSVFPTVFPVLAKGVPEYLGQNGVKLIGFDVPSVDRYGAERMVNHYALADQRIAILESVDLSRIEPGLYELFAFPLKIVGGDGSPVRAVLRDLAVTAPEGSRTLVQ